ncbi:MAG: H-X9-DG-CTERM domain-containing protein [Armatimonadota bacterium]
MQGKVLDCPSNSHQGKESDPDYFYVGGTMNGRGTFLAGMGLGDIKVPTEAPMVGDFASAGNGKPYIDHDSSNMMDTALKTLALRHSDGANIAYVDGHVALVKGPITNSSLFIASVNMTNAPTPLPLGPLFMQPQIVHIGYSPSAGLAYTSLLAQQYNLKIGMGGHLNDGTANPKKLRFISSESSGVYTVNASGVISATQIEGAAACPSWWNIGGGGCSITNYEPDCQPAYTFWNGIQNYLSTKKTSGTGTLTFVTNVTLPTVKKMAIAVHNGTGTSTASGTISEVRITQNGTTVSYPMTSTAALTTSDGPYNIVFAGVLLPVAPGQTIAIDTTFTANGASGMFLILEP